MSEINLMREIQVALTEVGARVFRNNVALAWASNLIHRATKRETVTLNPGDIVLRNARPIHAGLIDGASDYIGWSQNGLFVACEVKQPGGRITPKQVTFLGNVREAGGIAILADSPDGAKQDYEDQLHGNKF